MGDRSVFQQGDSAPQSAQTKDVWFGARSAQSKETEITREKHAATVVGYISLNFPDHSIRPVGKLKRRA